jgi:DNA replication protein DnaC
VGKRYLQAQPTLDGTVGYVEAFEMNLGSGDGLYLTGVQGSGKTFEASGIALRLVDDGYTVKFSTSIDLLATIRSTFGKNDTEERIVKQMAYYDLLVIDDLGKENVTDWSMQELYAIINARYETMKPTIITTQYTVEELISHWSKTGDSKTAAALLSRLIQTSTEVNIGNIDRRQQ